MSIFTISATLRFMKNKATLNIKEGNFSLTETFYITFYKVEKGESRIIEVILDLWYNPQRIADVAPILNDIINTSFPKDEIISRRSLWLGSQELQKYPKLNDRHK